MVQGDHDAIVTLLAHVQSMREEIRTLATATTTQNMDHETRIRNIEHTYVSWPKIIAVMTAFGTLMAGLGYIFHL